MAKLRIYVAGPIRLGDVGLNLNLAIQWADWLLDNGFAVFLPHTQFLWEIVSPKEPDVWLEHDLEWLPLCHAVLRLSGESEGADKETGTARESGIPVFYDDDPDALLEWARVQREIEASVQRRALQR